VDHISSQFWITLCEAVFDIVTRIIHRRVEPIEALECLNLGEHFAGRASGTLDNADRSL
jgi:hypothetical protein